MKVCFAYYSLALVVAFFSLGDAQTCQLCPDGSILQSPDQSAVMLDIDADTCGDVDTYLSSYTGSLTCDQLFAQDFTGVDVRSYCNCSDYQSTDAGVCGSLCGDNPFLTVDVPINALGGITCSEMADLTMAITEYFAPLCCSGLTPLPESCTLCPDGTNDISNSASVIPILNVSCQGYLIGLSTLHAAESDCKTQLAGFDVSGKDVLAELFPSHIHRTHPLFTIDAAILTTYSVLRLYEHYPSECMPLL